MTLTFEFAPGIGIIKSRSAQNGTGESTLELVRTNVAPFTVDTVTLPHGEQGVPYNASLAFSGPNYPYTVRLVAGSLPAGLSIGNDGRITGVPSRRAKTMNFTVEITQRGSHVQKTFTIRIFKALGITNQALKAAVNGRPFSARLTADGGTGPYSWSLSSGTLPLGVTLDSATGLLSGVPAQLGSFNLTFVVTDRLGGRAQRALVLKVK
jgi:hypothetical protein